MLFTETILEKINAKKTGLNCVFEEMRDTKCNKNTAKLNTNNANFTKN